MGRSLQLVKLKVIGLAQAGKTSIVHRMKYKTFLQRPKRTIGILAEVVDIGEMRFVLWDIGGQTLHALWKLFHKGTRGFLYVLDAADPTQFAHNQQFLTKVVREADHDDIPLAVLINKVDIAEPGQIATLVQTLDRLKQTASIKVFRTSAKTGVGLKEVMAWITERINLQKTKEAHSPSKMFHPMG
jgi:small GTP-binding protein